MVRHRLGKRDLRSVRNWSRYFQKSLNSTVLREERVRARGKKLRGNAEARGKRLGVATEVKIIVDSALKSSGAKDQVTAKDYGKLTRLTRQWIYRQVEGEKMGSRMDRK